MKRSLNRNYQPGFVEVIGPGGLSLGYEFDEVGNQVVADRGAGRSAHARLRLRRLESPRRNEGRRHRCDTGSLCVRPTGNRTSATVSGATTAYGYGSGSHRLNSVGATARSYDNAGNTTQIGGTAKAFAYNDLNRMSQYLESGIVKRNYAYNGRGEQVRTWLAANDDRYSAYDESGQWLGEYDIAGAPMQQIVWLGSLPVGVLTGSGTAQKLHYIEADALGTPRVVVDPARGAGGTAVWRWALTGEAFGNTAPDQDPDGDSVAFVFDMRFPGQRYDAVSGFNYNYFRDYEAATGRYLESDPIGLDGGVSTYGYVEGAPLTFIDPTGEVRAGAGAVLGGAFFCSRFPRLCNEVRSCIARPSACKKKFCRAGNAVYKSFCNNSGCHSSDSCLSLGFKTQFAASCYINRTMVGMMCYKGRQDSTHRDEIEKAKNKFMNCLKQFESRCADCGISE